MPEGPEVRTYADELDGALSNKKIVEVTARTKNAKAWLAENGADLKGKKVERVYAHGKNIVGIIGGGFYFYSHQMMWGRWVIVRDKPWPAPDKRERARITVRDAIAILNSAPIFEVGKGDPLLQVPFLSELGPNLLPYPAQTFDDKEFRKRLLAREHAQTPIGAALLNQTIVAGLGNYLRAEILFIAKLDPWRNVGDLSRKEVDLIAELAPHITMRAYMEHKTVTDELHERMAADPSLVYVPGKEYGTRHYVFRRTNLPCLICTTPIRQMRQLLGAPEAVPDPDAMSRIVYFCPTCQQVDIDRLMPKPVRSRKKLPL